jgi:nicotinamidase-related amidase
MQQAWFSAAVSRSDFSGLVDRVNRLSAQVRQANGNVIFVQHEGPKGDPFHPDQPGWRLLPDLVTEPKDIFVRKKSCDAFLGTALDDLLKHHGSEQLIIVGCATDYCVDTTVRSALARSIATIVPSDGHMSGDRKHLSARQIAEHHNAIWQDFIAPKGPARVIPSSQIVV